MRLIFFCCAVLFTLAVVQDCRLDAEKAEAARQAALTTPTPKADPHVTCITPEGFVVVDQDVDWAYTDGVKTSWHADGKKFESSHGCLVER